MTPHKDLLAVRGLLLAAVGLAFPGAACAVFTFNVGRELVSDVLSVVYSLGLALLFSSAFWPLPSLRPWSRQRRFQSAALLFLGVSYATHLSWELGWLVLHERIAVSPDAAWAYPWWAYIDGGDARYLTAPPGLIALELLSVVNGLVGAPALIAFKSRGEARAVLVLMATAVVHLYSASYYYLSEIVVGLPNVDTSSVMDTCVKFGLANAPWVFMPFVVFAWGRDRLAGRVTS